LADETKTSPFNPTPKSEYFFLLTILIYIGCHGYVNHLKNPNEFLIGYADYIAWSDPLEKILDGKILGKDFFVSYGPLFFFFQVPFYYFFGANHWALLNNIYIVFPLLSIALAHFYIRTFIKTPSLRILFVIVCLFQGSLGLYPSIRHICAEITLGLFFFCLTHPGKRFWFFITGIAQGISILAGTEYGIAIFIIICTTFILFCITNEKIHAKKLAKFFLSGLLVSLMPFISYMIYHGTLITFLEDYYFMVTSFENHSPPGSDIFFPPLPQISLNNFSESFNHFLVSQALRYYLPIIFYIIAGMIFILLFYQRKSPDSFKFFLLSCFGLLIFYRGLGTPAYNYVAYGLIPAITLGFIFLEKIWLCGVIHYEGYNLRTGYSLKSLLNSSLHTTILLFIFAWFFLTIENKSLFKFHHLLTSKKPEMVHYEKVGFEISKEAYDQYTTINSFIEKNVAPDEYIFTYPWGYYSHFTGRNSAIDYHDAAYGIVSNRDKKIALIQLEKRKPQFVILNTLNSATLIGAIRHDTLNQLSWRTEDSPLFAEHENLINLYILENYHLHKKFKIASILKRNKKKRTFDRTFKTTEINTANIKTIRLWEDSQNSGDFHSYVEIKPVTGNTTFEIKNRKIRIEYVLKEPQYATNIELSFLINQSPYKKFLTKSRLRIGTIESKTEKILIGCCTKGRKVTHSEMALGGPNINSLGNLNQIKTILEGAVVPEKKFLKKFSSIWVELETPNPYLIPKELRIVSLKLLFDERIEQD
jgi:hypothetical protein